MKENSDGNDTNVGSIGNSIEEDIERLKLCSTNQCNICGRYEKEECMLERNRCEQHILSDYKKVLKENEILKEEKEQAWEEWNNLEQGSYGTEQKLKQQIKELRKENERYKKSDYETICLENNELREITDRIQSEYNDLLKDNFKLKNELETKRKEYQETYKDVREELKELRKENEELKEERQIVGIPVRNKRDRRIGIVLHQWENGSVAVLESINPRVINTHDSWNTLEIVTDEVKQTPPPEPQLPTKTICESFSKKVKNK